MFVMWLEEFDHMFLAVGATHVPNGASLLSCVVVSIVFLPCACVSGSLGEAVVVPSFVGSFFWWCLFWELEFWVWGCLVLIFKAAVSLVVMTSSLSSFFC